LDSCLVNAVQHLLALRRWRYDRELCGAVDGFDEGDAAAAFEAVTGGGAVLLDGLEKIFEDGLVAAKIADDGGGSAWFSSRAADSVAAGVFGDWRR